MAEKPKTNGAAKPRETPVIGFGSYQAREFHNTVWRVAAPNSATQEDLDSPETFNHAPAGVKPFDKFEVQGRGFWQERLVTHFQPGRCVTIALRSVQLPQVHMEDQAVLPKNHRIYYDISEGGWIVERTNPDGTISVIGRQNEQRWQGYGDAHAYLLAHASRQ